MIQLKKTLVKEKAIEATQTTKSIMSVTTYFVPYPRLALRHVEVLHWNPSVTVIIYPSIDRSLILTKHSKGVHITTLPERNARVKPE